MIRLSRIFNESAPGAIEDKIFEFLGQNGIRKIFLGGIIIMAYHPAPKLLVRQDLFRFANSRISDVPVNFNDRKPLGLYVHGVNRIRIHNDRFAIIDGFQESVAESLKR